MGSKLIRRETLEAGTSMCDVLQKSKQELISEVWIWTQRMGGMENQNAKDVEYELLVTTCGI